MTKFSKPASSFRDCNRNSWYSFFDDVPLIAPVNSTDALYWRDSRFS